MKLPLIPGGRDHGKVLMAAAVEGMWPFKPVQVVVAVETDIDFMTDRFVVDMKFKDSDVIYYGACLMSRDTLAAYPEDTLPVIAETIKAAVRYRKTYADHEHVLGEN